MFDYDCIAGQLEIVGEQNAPVVGRRDDSAARRSDIGAVVPRGRRVVVCITDASKLC